MVREAIILAGGFGSRLQSVINDIPKPMAPVGDKPFLEFVLDYLLRWEIEKVVLAVGYKSDTILNHFGNNYKGIKIVYSLEETPLGTGGAIKKAFSEIDGIYAYIINGDTFFTPNLKAMYCFHTHTDASLTIALHHTIDSDRYGTVEVNTSNQIIGFKEKRSDHEGWINAGIYLMNKSLLSDFPHPEKFSFESDFLENHPNRFSAFPIKGEYFKDIGIPSDYSQFIVDSEAPSIGSKSFPKILFLDRDGVINKKIEGGYVTNWDEFEFCEGSLKGIAGLTHIFKYIFIVTNQQGIGKEIMTVNDLQKVHEKMILEINSAGGRVDGVYFCPNLVENNSKCRKPKPGMVFKAWLDFPNINIGEAWIVGDSQSDMELGNRMGYYNAFINQPNNQTPYNMQILSLYEFYKNISIINET